MGVCWELWYVQILGVPRGDELNISLELTLEQLRNSGFSLCQSLQSLIFKLTYPSLYPFKNCAFYLGRLPKSAPLRRFTLCFEYFLNPMIWDYEGRPDLEEEARFVLRRDNYDGGVARLDAAICELPHLEEVTIRLPHVSHKHESYRLEFAQWLRPRFPRVEANTSLKVKWENDPLIGPFKDITPICISLAQFEG